MLAFAAKLAGSLLVLGVIVASPIFVDGSAEQFLTENLARYASSHFGSSPEQPAAAAVAPVPRWRFRQDKDDFSAVGPAIDALLQSQPTAELGVAVRWSNGETLYLRNAREPFALASVAKTYMLVAYLHRLQIENRDPDENEMALLRSMIDVSDNDSAQEIWDALGGLDAVQSYLGSIGMKPLVPPIPDASEELGEARESWGDVSQTPLEMSIFLARLWQQELLSPEKTELTRSLLGSVVEEQSWGVTTDVDILDPAAKVLFKNGWYPEDDGWRINSAGIIIPAQGEPYVLVIFGRGFDTWKDGVETVNGVAGLINHVLLGQ
jgi:hypothetical protein